MPRRGSARARSDAALDVRVLGTVDYEQAWAQQRELAAACADGTGPDTLLLLEHPPVYTAGRRTTDAERPVDGTPVVDVDRGGKITWHGPGQLVGYPILKLADPIDVVDHVRRLEQALISVCDDLGLVTGRVEGRTGVWLAATAERPERKVAAIGVRVARGVTLHGFALNCDPDLTAFGAIVPCGITDAGVTSLSVELGRDVTVAEVRERTTAAVVAALEGVLAVTERDLVRTPVPAVPGLRLELDERLSRA
ncbi:lipoyl(octanoyl) transferase LipB [Rhodococcus aerolatus]